MGKQASCVSVEPRTTRRPRAAALKYTREARKNVSGKKKKKKEQMIFEQRHSPSKVQCSLRSRFASVYYLTRTLFVCV